MLNDHGLIREHLNRWYGLETSVIHPIGHGVINDNYRVEAEGRNYLFKVYNLSDDANVDFEVGILSHLAGHRFPCPRIVPGGDGRLFRRFGPKPAVLLRYIPGRMIRRLDPARIKAVGAGIGRLHRLLKDFPQKIERVTWEPEDIGRHIETQSDAIIRKGYPDAKQFVTYVKREFDSLDFPQGLPVGITHQDVKPENIIAGPEGQISFIDFNDCYRGTLLFDAMTTVIWSCFPRGDLDMELFMAYFSGYQKERPFTQVEKDNCYTALRFRLLRETFVWPMRFSPRVALEKGGAFLHACRNLKSNETIQRPGLAHFLGSGTEPGTP